MYFKMAANFQTQSELAYCGLSSLVMAYNTLKDPDIAGGWYVIIMPYELKSFLLPHKVV